MIRVRYLLMIARSQALYEFVKHCVTKRDMGRPKRRDDFDAGTFEVDSLEHENAIEANELLF